MNLVFGFFMGLAGSEWKVDWIKKTSKNNF